MISTIPTWIGRMGPGPVAIRRWASGGPPVGEAGRNERIGERQEQRRQHHEQYVEPDRKGRECPVATLPQDAPHDEDRAELVTGGDARVGDDTLKVPGPGHPGRHRHQDERLGDLRQAVREVPPGPRAGRRGRR